MCAARRDYNPPVMSQYSEAYGGWREFNARRHWSNGENRKNRHMRRCICEAGGYDSDRSHQNSMRLDIKTRSKKYLLRSVDQNSFVAPINATTGFETYSQTSVCSDFRENSSIAQEAPGNGFSFPMQRAANMYLQSAGSSQAVAGQIMPDFSDG